MESLSVIEFRFMVLMLMAAQLSVSRLKGFYFRCDGLRFDIVLVCLVRILSKFRLPLKLHQTLYEFITICLSRNEISVLL